jgi:hypothetical protein
VRRVAQGALAVLQAVQVHLDDAAADARGVRMCIEELQRGFQESRAQLHVGVHDVDVLAVRMLEPELGPDAAAALGAVDEPHDAHRKSGSDRHRPVRGVPVSQDHLAADCGDGGQAAAQRLLDPPFLVVRLDDDRDPATGVQVRGTRQVAHSATPCCE